MATSWKKIFDKFLLAVQDRNLFSNLTDEETTEVLAQYLKESAYLRFKKCKKNLSLFDDYEFFRQSFIGDGTTNEFIISQYNESLNTELFCEVGGNGPSYSFDVSAKKYTISPNPSVGASVVCGFSFYGEYETDLTEEEILILVSGMIIAWTSHIINDETKLRDRLTYKDYKAFSGSALIRELKDLRDKTILEHKALLVSYSFNDFSGF